MGGGANDYRGLLIVDIKPIINNNENWPDNIDVILQAFRIGDLGVAAIPFEVFAEIGLEIKAKSPFQKSFTIESFHQRKNKTSSTNISI